MADRPERTALARLVDSPAFTGIVFLAIVGNAVVLGMQTYEGLEREHGDLLDLLNEIFLGVFVVELALRVGAYGRRPQDFFRDGWNIFDFLVVAAAFVPGVRENATVLRLARLLRLVRVVRLLPELRVLLLAVLRSLPPLFSMTVLTTMILFAYGMVGWLLFGDENPGAWGDIGQAMLTLFVMLTLENFPAQLERGMEIHPWSVVYFVSFVLVAALIILNVLIGVVLHSMEEAREITRRAKQPRLERHETIAERVAALRQAVDELELELAAGAGPVPGRPPAPPG
ncbi:MAG: ion transporter [Gaiellaceae bacterium]